MKKTLLHLMAIAIAFIGTSRPLWAGTDTWSTTGTTANFNLAGNWSSLPVNGQDSLVFGAASSAGTTLNNNLAANFSIFDMQFTSAAPSYTIAGNAITMNGNIVLVSATAQQIINLNMNLTGDRIMQAQGANIRLGGNLSGVGGISKTATGTLFLTGTNTYIGNTNIKQGTIAVQSINNNLGSGTIKIGDPSSANGGILAVQGAGESTSKVIDLAGTTGTVEIVNSVTSGTLSLTGNFTATGAGSKTLKLTGGSSSEVGSISGGIVNNSTTNKTSVQINNGIWTLSGSNTYTGNTTVGAGTLVLAQNSQTAFTIGGSGTNNQILGTGTINLNGHFAFDLSGAGTTLGDSWAIVNVGTLTETFGSTFDVQNFFSVNSTLWAKSIGGGHFYNFDETTGGLSVTTVPEPSTWALLGIGLAVAVLYRRRSFAERSRGAR